MGRSSGEEFPEDMVDHRAAIRGADADAQARDVADVLEDGFHAVVAAGGAVGADADAAERQRDVIEYGEDLRGLEFCKSGRRRRWARR